MTVLAVLTTGNIASLWSAWAAVSSVAIMLHLRSYACARLSHRGAAELALEGPSHPIPDPIGDRDIHDDGPARTSSSRRSASDSSHAATSAQVGFVEDDRPVILPVNYVFDDGFVVFRSTARQQARSRLARTSVAFEIDAIDPMYHGGFSVLAYGPAEVVDSRRRDRAPLGASAASVVAGGP